MDTLKIKLLSILLVLGTCSFAQVKLGVKFSPGITFSKATAPSTVEITDNSTGLRFIGGLIADYQFSENYYLSTGLAFATRKTGFKGTYNLEAVNEVYNTQHVQIPFALKMYTNEVAVDKRVYFQAGVNADIKVKDNVAEQTSGLITKLGLFDTSLAISSGLEMSLGTNTAAFGGISFQKGLLNMISETPEAGFAMKYGFIGLEIGVKF